MRKIAVGLFFFLLQGGLFADGEFADQEHTSIEKEQSDPVQSPEEINRELAAAQARFEEAEKMFIPWYTGPLIAGSASTVPKGRWNIQGYLYLTDAYSRFTGNRRVVNQTDIYTVNPLVLFQYGLTEWMDITVTPQAIFNWQGNASASEFGDLPVTLGFQLLKETPYVPSLRFTVGETFPTGKYDNLSPNKGGIDSSGGGVYKTVFGLNISKIFWNVPVHPYRFRLSTNYAFADNKASVDNFHAYGGGVGTNGDVSVGGQVNVDLGFEISLTQVWVFAADLAYFYQSHSSFTGTPGVISTGAVASNGAPSSDQLSLAPAIEYNFDENGGLIVGIWFPLTGRNSSNFISLVSSLTYLF
ncbi:MAG: hypothetical protein S4CHLAM102_08940 [Chlamydiia bacterium]|nr:hypothetical protein [Chlamydiia bacterium]